MAIALKRWRGPRRPDVQELRPEDSSVAAASSDSPQFNLTGQANYAFPHFKYNQLSAGRLDSSMQGRDVHALSVMHARPSIMDATRSFESDESRSANDLAQGTTRQQRMMEQSRTERYAAGLGYGERHGARTLYLSRDLPARHVPSVFEDQPCVFPTVPIPSRADELGPTAAADADMSTASTSTPLDQLPFHEQQARNKTFRRQVASGLGYGAAKGTDSYYAYLANTYWKPTASSS